MFYPLPDLVRGAFFDHIWLGLSIRQLLGAMVKITFIVLFSLHLALILTDTVKNFSSIFPEESLTKVLPLTLMLILALLDLIVCRDATWSMRLSSYLLASNAISLNSPSSFDRQRESLISSGIMLLFFLTFLIIESAGCRWPGAGVLPLGVSGLIFLQSVLCKQDNDIVAPFDLTMLLEVIACLMLYLHAEGHSESLWLLPSLSFALYALLIYISAKKYIGGFYWLSRKRHAVASKQLPSGNFKALYEGSRMDEIFSRLEKYMADEQPYLRDDLTLEELARAMLTNKTYLSRTINLKSGKNFCTYINWYRINYSLKIIEKDVRVKVVELAVMSGFHTVASYNMAFRMFMGDTPSEYIRTQKAKALERAHTPFHDGGT